MSEGLRILLATCGSRGDVDPLLAVALQLRAAGHRVSLAAAPDYAARARAVGIAFVPVGQRVEAWLEREADIVARPLAFARKGLGFLREEARAQLEALAGPAAEVDLLVGCGLLVAGPTLADLHGLPYRHVVFCPQALPSRRHAPLSFPFESGRALPNRALWWVQRAYIDHAVRGVLNAERRRHGLAPLAEVYAEMQRGVVVACDAQVASVPDDVAFDWVQTGPWRLGDPGTLDPALEAFLAAGEPPVYVGFGSMTDPHPAKTARIVAAALRRVGRRGVFVGSTAAVAPEDAKWIHTADAVPHPALFPRCAALVHHGGAGTVATALRSGRPQVIVPHLLDQFFWGRRLRQVGVSATTIPRVRLGPERLADAVARCLDEPALAERARQITGELAEDGRERGAEALVAAARAGAPSRARRAARSASAPTAVRPPSPPGSHRSGGPSPRPACDPSAARPRRSSGRTSRPR